MWKQIKNSTFFINEKGEVKTEDRYINSHKGSTTYQRLQKGRILKGGCTINGYEFVTLEDGKHYFRHRLVLETFKPNPYPNIYTDVNHIDENPHNNNLDNLEWTTHKENCNYGKRKNGNQDKAKKVYQYDLNGNLIKIYNSLTQAEKENNTSRGGSIGRCCRGELKQFNNYKWAYYENKN